MVISVVEIMINMGEMISSEDKMKISVVNFMISVKIPAVEMIINVVDIREGFKKQNGNFYSISHNASDVLAVGE